jgi:acyl-CoA reductase-like NAD-dependent aldehyde dehydrogenase
MIGASVERIYVEKSVYVEFVRHCVEIAKTFRLGDPLSKETSLGPVVSLASAARIRQQIDDAGESISAQLLMMLIIIVAAGARLVLGDVDFPQAKRGTTTIAPHVLVDVDHSKYRSWLDADAKPCQS